MNLTRLRCASAAFTISIILVVVASVEAVRVEAPPPPLSPSIEEPVPPKLNRTRSPRLASASDPFRVPRAAPAQDSVQQIIPVQTELMRLTGIAALPGGGLAIVQSGNGSRVLRVGDEWEGMRLREVKVGEAVFVTRSGESTTLRIRKAGS